MNGSHAVGAGLGISSVTYLSQILAYYQGPTAPASAEAALIAGVAGAIGYGVYSLAMAFINRGKGAAPVEEPTHA